MNPRAKGRSYELKCEKELIKQGYLTYRAKGATKFNLQVDIFSLFDLMALKKIDIRNERNAGMDNDGLITPKLFKIERRYIQVKVNKKLSEKELIPFKEFKKNYTDANDKIQIWSYWQMGKRKKIKGWEINII